MTRKQVLTDIQAQLDAAVAAVAAVKEKANGGTLSKSEAATLTVWADYALNNLKLAQAKMPAE